jgi:hypothetical protein
MKLAFVTTTAFAVLVAGAGKVEVSFLRRRGIGWGRIGSFVHACVPLRFFAQPFCPREISLSNSRLPFLSHLKLCFEGKRSARSE